MTQLHIKMALNQCDQDNADHITRRMNANNNAETVSASLDIVRSLSEIVAPGEQIFIKKANGDVHEVSIRGLNS